VFDDSPTDILGLTTSGAKAGVSVGIPGKVTNYDQK
jgi:hypothetical protein